MNHYNDGGGHIESLNIYDEVASFDSIADAQIDMICHPEEVVSFDCMITNLDKKIGRKILQFFV